MKKLILIIPALLIAGCSVQKDCCDTNNHQCDEFYPYYNSYYPNTQTIYYVPVQDVVTPPLNNGNILYNTRRPERLGAMGEKQKTPRKDVYGNTLQPGDYPTRGASGQRGVGNLNKPNAPKTTRE